MAQNVAQGTKFCKKAISYKSLDCVIGIRGMITSEIRLQFGGDNDMKSRLFGTSFLSAMFLGLVAAFPGPYLDLEGEMGPTIRREIRSDLGDAREVADLLAPANKEKKKMSKQGTKVVSGYYRTYGGGSDGAKGYEEQTQSKGDHGYKKLDTFHKVNGDNYGFEEHTAFGNARGRDKSKDGDHEGAGTIFESYYSEDDDGDYQGYTDGVNENIEDGDENGSYEYHEGYSENYGSDDDGSHGAYTSGEDYY